MLSHLTMIVGEGLHTLLNYQRLLENRLIDKETQAYDPKVMDDLIKIHALKLKFATVNLDEAHDVEELRALLEELRALVEEEASAMDIDE